MKERKRVASILQITDLHILPGNGEKLLGVDTEKSFDAVLKDALANHPLIDLILVTGDLAQEPGILPYRKIASRLSSVGIPCVCLPGNHDNFTMMLQILNDGNISCRKNLFLKGWQIIILNSQVQNSHGGHITETELEFLDGSLSRHPEKPALIAVHHHCRKTQSQWMDTMMIDNSEDLLAVLSRHQHSRALICGHIHQILDVNLEFIQLWGTPSTCFQFKPGSRNFELVDDAPAYRIIDLFDDGQVESTVHYLEEKLLGLQFSGRY